MRTQEYKPGKMLENLDTQGVLETVKIAELEAISREGVIAPSETATPALAYFKQDEDTVQTSRDTRVSTMKAIKWVDSMFPFPLKTAEQNYWLGFLMCDGYIQGTPSSNYSVCLELGIKDAYIVSRFAKFIGCKAASRRRSVRAVRACGSELDLFARHGIVMQKTGKEVYPTSVTNDGAFIRGVLDGDGSVGVYKDRRSLSLSFCSQSHEFLDKLAVKLHDNIGCFSNISACGDRNCSRLSYTLGVNMVAKLYAFLYTDNPREPRMHRKERIMRLFIESRKRLLSN